MGNHDRLVQGGEGPPSVPDIDRRIHLYPLQVVGGGLLAVLPLLALLGMLDQRPQVEVRTTPALEVGVEYPARIRTTREASLEVTVRNRSEEPVEGLTIVLPEGHLAGFGVTGILPGFATAEGDGLRLEPGERATVRILLRAERVGRHRDSVEIVPGTAGGERIAIPLATFILP